MFNKMKQVTIQNTLDITNYTVSFILDFNLYPNNARIRELPSVDVSQLHAIQISFVFENLTSGKVIIKDATITPNDNFFITFFIEKVCKRRKLVPTISSLTIGLLDLKM